MWRHLSPYEYFGMTSSIRRISLVLVCAICASVTLATAMHRGDRHRISDVAVYAQNESGETSEQPDSQACFRGVATFSGGCHATGMTFGQKASSTAFPPTPPVRGVAGDLWADVVLGKPHFAQIGPASVVPFKVFNPGGVVVDRSTGPGKAYIWDSGNSRILGIDLAKCYKSMGPCTADIVIGQPSPQDHSACNGDSGVQEYPYRATAGPETLCGIYDHSLSPGEGHTFVTMAVDRESALFVNKSW